MRADILDLPTALPLTPPAAQAKVIATGKVLLALAVLSVTALHPAHAQDVLGISSFTAAAILVLKGFCGLAVVWGFFRLMSGRHTMESLVCLGLGVAGVYKADAIVALAGG